MKVFITCTNGLGGTAQDAQEMVSDIAHQMGFRNMGIYFYNSREESEESRSARYDGIIASISPGDIVFFQHPTWHQLEFEEKLIDRIKAYGGRIIIVVHDVESLMIESSRFMLRYVIGLFNSAEALVVPSYAMKRFLKNNGIRENMKFAVQEIWDYTTDIHFRQTPQFRKEIHFAGNPSKFLFPQQWGYNVPLKVYTSEECTGENVQEMGWMDPNSLLLELSKGGFGLVWYGDEYWHQYMKYNNTIKLSAYLAAGIPIIVPRGISNQYLIEKNHLGLAVDSLDEAVNRVRSMEKAEYRGYVQHVGSFAPLIRNGYFTKKFLIDAIQMLLRADMSELPITDTVYREKMQNSDSAAKTIRVMDMQETLAYIRDKRISIARFGDGEVDLMTGHSIPYQDYDGELAEKLKKIITMPDNEKLLVCLPDVFEKRERYTAECNSFWDAHLNQYQDFYREVLSGEKQYGSTFLSRPYIDRADKSISGKHFQDLKEFFSDKSILIVEGVYSRSGVGNDLFQGAKSVERIICPSRNAYGKYEEILNAVKRHGADKLILLMLGPTAKALAYDLALAGYWAVDIGHIDSEYEWYKMGVTQKTKLNHKHTAEFNFDEFIDLQADDIYEEEVVERVVEE
ncbi:MAG: SP_1767 family glycosyltransferase [Roseburia sp.]|nr:SP_1767 family glycosyltransferase [Roseburia sp.]MCM1099127.1 SP_1767 family glycosyltransferase [Ruminococcus flavefaciens]